MGLLIKLQDGDTALKSLKFGNDRPGGGDSGQPYIKNPIEGTNSPANKDFLLRGGINAPLDAVEDVARLTKYFFDFKNPSGLLFTAKQNLLSRTAVKAEVAEKIPGNVPGPAYAGGKINEGVYTPLSTIAEAGIVAFGGHLNKQGLDPTGLSPTFSIKKYGPTAFVLNEPKYNKWFETPAPTQDFVRDVPQVTSRFDVLEATTDLNFSNRLLRLWYTKELPKINSNPNLYSYSGGPGSTLGFGTTNIKFATLGDGLTPSRTGVNNIQYQTNKNTFLTGSTQQDIQVNKFYLNNVDGVPTYQETLDITKFLGASKLQGLPEDKIWYNLVTSESPQTDVFNYVLNLDKALNNDRITALSNNLNYLTKKDLSLDLTGRSSENATYFSPINEILRNSGTGATQGVIGSGRQLIVDPKYDVSSGSYLAVDPLGKILDQYSSENTLWNDNLNQNSQYHYATPKDHKKGYLANLDKNAGYYYDSGSLTFVINQYPRGIAPDFRLTSRKIRGFDDYVQSTTDGYEWGGYDAITKDPKKTPDYKDGPILDKFYYTSTDKRTSQPINNGKDLISFKIGITSPTSINQSKDLQFKAYIDQFSDTYSNEWKSQTYMGRAEKQYKYNNFDRSISLGFTVVADNEKNLNEMYVMLNTLAASIAPTYTTKGYMAGNLHRLTLGNYLYEQWGIMNGGFTYEITEESPWNIDSGKQLPYYIRVTGVKFTPIHTFRPDYEYNNVSQYINQK